MRKLFALVATMAMVLSMFAGVAFASTTPAEIDLATELVIYTGDADDDLVITGRILDADGAVATGNYAFTIAQGTEEYYGLARAGIINTVIPGDATPGNYELTLDDYGTVEAAEFDVTYKLTTADTLGFTWGQTGDFAYVGKLTGVAAGTVSIVDANGTEVDSVSVSSRGQFIFLLDKVTDFAVPGALELRYTDGEGIDVLVAEGEIAPGALTFTSTATAVYGLEQDLEFTVAKKSSFNLPTSADYEILLVDGDDEYLVTDGAINLKTTNIDVTVPAEFVKDEAGSYKFTVNVYVAGEVAYTATNDFVVGKPASLNLVGFDSTASVEDGWTATIGTLKVVKIDRYGDAEEATSYDITAVGAGVDEEFEGVTSGAITLEPTKGGTINFTITAYDADGDKMGSFTRTITVDGGVATINITELEVGTTATVTITVKDENGKAVNNAFLYAIGSLGTEDLDIDSSKVNVINGVYTIEIEEDTFDAPGSIAWEVEQWNGTSFVKIATTDSLTITGKDVYDVTLGLTDDVLAGETTVVNVIVKEEGKFLYPSTITVKNDDDTWTSEGATPDFTLTKVDTNGDKVYDSYKITMPAFTEAGTYTVTAANAEGTEIGTATFEVVLPIISANVDKVTNNAYSTITFTVVDPRDNSVLDWNVDVVANTYVDMFFAEAYGDEDVLFSDYAELEYSEEEAYSLTVLVDADYELAEDEEEVAALYFVVYGDAAVELAKTLEVVEPSFTANPATVVTGVPNVVTFTLVDANGAALEGYNVYRGATKIGTTDANGQVAYTVAQVGTDPLEFTVKLDSYEDEEGDDVVFERDITVKPGFDTAAPVVSAPATVDTNTAVITVTDNVRVVRVKINGVEDTNFFPGTTYEKTVTLVPGANNFVVEAMDNNYNTVKTTVTINYTAKSVVLQGTQVERKGANLFVQIRQFEELGAALKWDAASKTATFTVGNTTVVVTVGSTTATVNGVAKTMPQAPYLAGGRTMVPTRFISEALGWKVDWAAGDIVTITLP